MTTSLPTAHNWPVYGHNWAVDHLRKAIINDRTRHAYLFTGVDGIGKRTLAYAFAMALNAPADAGNIDYDTPAARKIMSGNHPDIVLTERDEKTGALKIAAIRELATRLALKPYETRYRVAILDDFQFARPQAQDALLKTLEEPATTSILLVLASSTDNILATITSRCQVMALRPLSVKATQDVLAREYDIPPPDADLLARISGGRVGWAINATEPESPVMAGRAQALDMLEDALRSGRVGRFNIAGDVEQDKLVVLPLLALWITYWRDVVMINLGASFSLMNADREDMIVSVAGNIDTQAATRALNATRQAQQTIMNTNANIKLVLEAMFLDYPGL